MRRKVYWTKERCYKESLKYKTKQDFKLKAAGAYTAARRNNWLEEIWLNFMPIGNLYKRCIYVYEFSDNSVYVGLTFNLEGRDKQHNKNKNSLVFKHIKKTKLKPLLKKISDYIDMVEASELEGKTIEDYKNKGWNIINKKKAGSLGGNTFIWTKNNCIKVAKKCKSRNEFLKKYHGAYTSSKNNGWLNEVYLHLKLLIKPKNYWTKQKCHKVSKKCKTREEFRKKYLSAYTISIKNGWFKEICSHMVYEKNQVGYWTLERCKKEALKYNNKLEFLKKSGGAYSATVRNKWIKKVCSHMKVYSKQKGYWNKDRCKKESLKYKTKNEFAIKSGSAYFASYKNGWLKEFF